MRRASRRKQYAERANGTRGNDKLSERLVDLAEPFRKSPMSRPEYEILVKLASAAWNLSTFPIADRESALSHALRELPPHEQTSARDLVWNLLRRKEGLFPEDHRFIANVRVIDLGTGRLHVEVASISEG